MFLLFVIEDQVIRGLIKQNPGGNPIRKPTEALFLINLLEKGAPNKMYLLNGFLIFCLLLFCPLDGFAKMYKWVDKNGQVHITGTKPPEGVTKIKEYGKDGIRDEPEDETNKMEAEADPTLKDVDLVKMGGFIKDGILKISFYYINRDTDKQISWEEGTVKCECQIYEGVGKRRKRKGQKIDSIKKKLKRYGQDIYVDIPKKYLNKGKEGIVECLVDTGYIKKKITDNPSFGGINKKTSRGKTGGGTASQTMK
jgi:hypothetical protein